MSEETDFMEILRLCMWGGVFGAAGGAVRVVRAGMHNVWGVLAQIFVSGFCGICAYSLLADTPGITDTMMVGICGIAGNSGGIILDAVQATIIERINKSQEQKP